MKGFILWALFGVFVFLAITAVDMGEYAIAAMMAVMSLGCLFTASPRRPARRAAARRPHVPEMSRGGYVNDHGVVIHGAREARARQKGEI